jgi:hypothetical protein
MHMRVVGERRAPGVEDGGDADAGAQMLGVGDALQQEDTANGVPFLHQS